MNVVTIEYNFFICLWGGVQIPTGGIVRELWHEPVQFRYRQYSLDEKRQ